MSQCRILFTGEMHPGPLSHFYECIEPFSIDRQGLEEECAPGKPQRATKEHTDLGHAPEEEVSTRFQGY